MVCSHAQVWGSKALATLAPSTIGACAVATTARATTSAIILQALAPNSRRRARLRSTRRLRGDHRSAGCAPVAIVAAQTPIG
jgi:hypothetical protein